MRASGYYCAEDDLFKAVNCSLKTSKKYLANLEKITTSWAGKGLIDPLQNLRNEPIYLWSGRRDATVHQAAVNALRSYYGDFGADVFQYDNQFAAGHGWESPYGPAQCNLTQSPFINLCYDSSHRVYDSEQVWLSRFLGNLQPKNEATLNGAVLPLNQNEFASGGGAAGISMAGTGYVFVPQICASGAACGLVLALHGCAQGDHAIGKTFINDAGINQWADSNNIVVLYPQAVASPSNLFGCWDWWGYLGDSAYAQKNGQQIKALYKMVARASGGSATRVR